MAEDWVNLFQREGRKEKEMEAKGAEGKLAGEVGGGRGRRLPAEGLGKFHVTDTKQRG